MFKRTLLAGVAALSVLSASAAHATEDFCAVVRKIPKKDGEFLAMRDKPAKEFMITIRLHEGDFLVAQTGQCSDTVDNGDRNVKVCNEYWTHINGAFRPDTDLLILDNLSTLLTSRSEAASDAWVPMQKWFLRLRREGKSVLLIHHAGTNGRQRGTSRREDALDTVIALRRPENYSPEQGARFEIHFEKLRNRVDAVGAMPFEAKLDTLDVDGQRQIRWSASDLNPPMLKQAAELFADGLTVREVAAALKISKSEAGRLRLRALTDAILVPDDEIETDKPGATIQ